MMTALDLVELVKAVSPIIAAITGVIAVYLGRTIHTLVNSAMTAVKADLALANQRITDLQALVTAISAKRSTIIPPEMMVPPPSPPTVAEVFKS